MTNKYDQMDLPVLIKAVQAFAIKYSDKKALAKLTQKYYSRQMIELSDMRHSCRERLRKMDRNDSSYFSVGLHVEYRHDLGKETRNGIITGIDGDYCIIRLEGEEYEIKVDPAHLTIKFLRTTY